MLQFHLGLTKLSHESALFLLFNWRLRLILITSPTKAAKSSGEIFGSPFIPRPAQFQKLRFRKESSVFVFLCGGGIKILLHKIVHPKYDAIKQNAGK